MKQEIDISQPKYLIEDCPGRYEVFSWLEYVVAVPNPVFLVTTRNANGAANANLQSWGLLIGEKGNYSSLLALPNKSHTYDHILREGEWCVGFPSFENYPQCFKTINCNAPDNVKN
jgi:flavin reductase (DIM6/NTAB) family NADH-FMN oxidoreductase RutF